jgi:hypothetical protein
MPATSQADITDAADSVTRKLLLIEQRLGAMLCEAKCLADAGNAYAAAVEQDLHGAIDQISHVVRALDDLEALVEGV